MNDREKNRVVETLEMIPDRVQSVLELGCGDGRILNRMPARWTRVGLDADQVRVSQVEAPRLVGNIASIPVRDEQFDLVLAAEILEHLDELTFHPALIEMERVTRRFIMITVPFEESLAANYRKCSRCSCIYHAWGHSRRFTTRDLRGLFRRAVLVERRFFSPREAKIPSLVYFAVIKVGRVWGASGVDESEACPLCGGPPNRDQGNLLGKLLIRAVWRMQKHLPLRKPIWVACLYRKET